MEALEEDLKHFLKEADKVVEEKVEEKKGVLDLLFKFKKPEKKKKLMPLFQRAKLLKAAEGQAKGDAKGIYAGIKASFGMLSW